MVLLFLTLLALPLASRAKDTFYIEPVNVVPGELKTITLNLDNSQVFRGFQTDIELPEGLKIASKSNGNFDISLTDRGSFSFSVSSNLMSDGSVRILGYSTQGESIKGNQGALVRISVRASSDFSGGYIKLKNSIFSDVNNRDVKLDNSQLFVGTKEQNDVSVKGGEISPEVSKAFSLELSNESEMTAFQMDVVLPNGLSLDLSKTRLTGRCGNHQLQTKQLGNGKVRIICMSSDNTSISGKIGSVIDLWIKAEKGIAGNQIVKLENIIFSDVKARTYRMDPLSFVVDVKYVPATSVSISESNMQLEVSDARQLTASLLPENCTDKTILWKSDNEKVATVSDNGMIIARSAGQCSIIASTADNLIQAKCVVTVVKIPLTAHVANTTKVYGDANPEFNITYSGFRDGDSEVGFSVPASISTIVDNSSKVGKYDIVASGAVSDKYEISYIPGTLTVTKAPLSIYAGNYTKKQGDAMPVFKASYAGFKNGENESVLTKQPVFSCEANEASAPAEYAVTISGADAENYEISYEQGHLTVVEADVVVVRAKSYSRQYGDDSPVFEFETEGAALDGTPEIVCSAVANSPVGSYTIEVKQGSIKNYNVHFESGSLVITKAPLSISAGNYTKKQGDAMPVFKASYVGFKNGEDESVLTKQPVFSCEANEASAPAEYAVTISGADAENYDISYEQGRLTVVEADAVVVRAKSYSRQYGDENPVFEFETEGAALDGTPEIACSAVANSPVGSYTIEVKQGSIKNYNVHFESGSLVITKAPLSISAGNYTKKQGDAMPVFKASYAGFKNGENESVLTKLPVFSCEANEASAPAEYAVTISGAEAENYEISYEQGRLTVVEADAVVVRAKSYSRQYGDENPMFEFETDGAALDGTPEIVCSAVANSPVGSYTIEVKQGSIKNYNVHFESGSLVITKAPLSISAGNYTKKQGDAMPVFKASYVGFKNGEDESVLTKQPVFSCEANEASAPAEYAVTISGADAENYEISYKQGHLTVVEADAVVVRAKSYNRQYGDENPVFEFETEGAALDGTPEIVCSAVANSPVGSYTIDVKQGSIKNYNVHFESGSLVITKAPLSISAGNYTKKQGDAMPVFKASYAGFKNGENESVLTKQPVFSCKANEASAPAEYSVTISGADAENYEISYKQGVLTVTGMPKPIISTDEATLRITTETDNAVIYYTLDGTEPNENARKYTEPINLYASCEIKAIAVKGDAKSEVSSAEYPNIVKVGDIITANIINNGEENLPMIFKVTSVYPFNVEMENKEDYVEGWNNERDVSGTLEIPVVVKSNGISYCVKKLGDNSLARCVNVSSLKLNEGLESIGHQAIRWCRNIKELIVPNSVKEVWGAFLTEDHGLVSVVLGSGLETIHTDAFWGVSMNLKSFISLSTNPAKCVEPDRTFTSLPEDVTLYVPLGSKSAYETAPGWDYFAGHIVEMDMSPATVKVKDYSREYGDDNPTFKIETESAALIGEPEIICSADKKSKVGTYEIEINKGTIKNYYVTFVPGSLTVTKAPLVVTADNYTITQGDKLPEFTASYSGFKNGEDVSVLTKQPVFSCDTNEASAPGEYPITVYGVEADNYEVKSYIAGTLTVLKRELKKQTITWDQEIKAKVGSTIEMNATASSGLPVRYSYALAPGVETAYQVPQIEGNKITFPQNGMYLLVAIQDGNNEYAAATDTLDVCAISDDEGLMYIDGIYYKYTDDGSALKVVRGYNPYRGKVEIPATVNGLPVTEVDRLAMYACYYLKELVFGDNVKKCGHEAFGASINLCNVTLPVGDVGLKYKWVFNCDRGIREIHCRSSIPYVVDEGIFNGAVDYDKCILYVPVGTKQAYRNAEVWKYFTHIVEENVSTSISNINVEKKGVWYTLQGVKLFAKPNIPGVYIHNGKKIIVR